jgi:hypothetical protein
MNAPMPYGATCTWWDSMDKVGSLTTPPMKLTRGNGTTADIEPSSLPCCPHCKGVLMQVPSEDVWWENVRSHAEKTQDADYPNFIRWLRGRCFASFAAAKAQYDREAAVLGKEAP